MEGFCLEGCVLLTLSSFALLNYSYYYHTQLPPGQASSAAGQPPSNEVVLSNFFNSLLNKKPSAAMKMSKFTLIHVCGAHSFISIGSPASPSSHHRNQQSSAGSDSQA